MLNMDAAGGASRKGIVLHCWDALEPFFNTARQQMHAEMPVGQKVHSYSDHFPFFLKGVPSCHMGDPEAPPSGRGFGHTAYDTLDKVKLENLRAASAVGARVALRCANADDFSSETSIRRSRPENCGHRSRVRGLPYLSQTQTLIYCIRKQTMIYLRHRYSCVPLLLLCALTASLCSSAYSAEFRNKNTQAAVTASRQTAIVTAVARGQPRSCQYQRNPYR